MPITVVTGPVGHVGANLVRAPLALGHRVRALVHHDRRALQDLDVEILSGDLQDVDSLRRAFSGTDHAHHSAGYLTRSSHEWGRLEAVNVADTRNVVETCLACGLSRLVHQLHRGPGRRAARPARGRVTAPVESRRHSPYARSKAAGERLVRQGVERGLDAVILYPTAILGPHDYGPGLANQGLQSLCQLSKATQ